MSRLLTAATALMVLCACSSEPQPESGKSNYLGDIVDASVGPRSDELRATMHPTRDVNTERDATASIHPELVDSSTHAVEEMQGQDAGQLRLQCSAFRNIVARALVEQHVLDDALAGAPLPGTAESDDFVPPDVPCAACTEQSRCNVDESVECIPVRACIARHCLCSDCLETANTDLCDCADRCFAEGYSVCRSEWIRFVECQVDSCESTCEN